MKLKKSFIFLAALIMLALISIFLTREEADIQSLPQPQKEAAQQQGSLMDYIQQLRAVSPAITVVQKPSPKKEVVPPKEEERKFKQSRQPEGSLHSPGQGPTGSGEGPKQPSGEEPASGITKLNKRPPPQVQEEMEVRGIIMY